MRDSFTWYDATCPLNSQVYTTYTNYSHSYAIMLQKPIYCSKYYLIILIKIRAESHTSEALLPQKYEFVFKTSGSKI